MARKRPRRYGNSSSDRPTVTMDRSTVIDLKLSRTTASRPAIAARAYYKGREIRVFDARRGYYVEVDGVTNVPGPFHTIREAIDRGRVMVDPALYAVFSRRVRRRSRR